jgi:hypothetical protein
MVLLSRRGADSSLAARAAHRSTLLLMVRIGELENRDVYVPVTAECDAEGYVVDGMCRVASGTGEPLAGCARSSRDGSSW